MVSFGKSGALGVFAAVDPLPLRRGQAVVIETSRGIEIGTVLRAASLQQARVLGAMSSGTLLRQATSEDGDRRTEAAAVAQHIFESGRARAERDGLTLEVLDVDVTLDGRSAIVQFIGADADAAMLAPALEQQFPLAVRFENLAAPMPEDHDHAGCGKPDCGRNGDAGCSTCGSGGCSTCGSGTTDLREYFSHLRTQMASRIPLASS